MKTREKEKNIAGMHSLCRELAAKYLGMSLSKLDKHLAACRSKKHKPKIMLKYIQYEKHAPVWFPVPWLDEFIQAVAANGGAI